MTAANSQAATVCAACGGQGRQTKAGSSNGRQRYKCGICQHRYIPAGGKRGYSADVREKAAVLRSDGLTIREIAVRLGVNHQSVANWLRTAVGEGYVQHAAPPPVVPPASQPSSPARRRPTIRNVAVCAGVSVASVSNYLNHRGRMSDLTRQRIRAAVEQLNFTPSALTQAIRERHTSILGVLTIGMHHLGEVDGSSLAPAMLRGFYDGAADAGNDLLLYTNGPGCDRGDRGLRFLDGHIDGLLWVSPTLREPYMERVVAAGLPVVALLTRLVPNGAGFVTGDNFGAMHSLVTHLAERGHRRIAYAGPVNFSDLIDRQEGYRLALAEHALLWDPALQIKGENLNELLENCRQTLDSWLTLPDPPTAIMCFNDSLAAGFAELLHTRGLRVPEDIALTGFDDSPIAVRAAGGLTTVRQPFRQMGRLAVESLLGLIQGTLAAPPELTVPLELIIRASTAGNK